ncbi:hypothetical protein AVEN_88365-1 [Araneus ventricosus]|uniref:Uncharacterized protein n=1 Tax=Araneus ventricosus TaxID=182803 RepID=A0A4Y2IBM7_ARAVE|nr:hypothetical protein AVEN_88365-1 [Araneus ventricosus]
MDQHSYRSASNSLLARTADRTPKTFALQGDPSRSTNTHLRHTSALLIQFPPAGRDVIQNYLVHSSVSSLLIEISRRFQHLSDPIFRRQGQGTRRGGCKSSHTYPCKTLFPTIRLTLLGSDFPCL